MLRYDLNRSGAIEIDELVEFARSARPLELPAACKLARALFWELRRPDRVPRIIVGREECRRIADRAYHADVRFFLRRRPWHQLDLRGATQPTSRNKPDHPTPTPGAFAAQGRLDASRHGSGTKPVRAWDHHEPGVADRSARDSADSDDSDDPVADADPLAAALPTDWRERLPAPSLSPAPSRRKMSDPREAARKRGAAQAGPSDDAEELWRLQGGRAKFDGEYIHGKETAASAGLPRRNWNSAHARTKPVRPTPGVCVNITACLCHSVCGVQIASVDLAVHSTPAKSMLTAREEQLQREFLMWPVRGEIARVYRTHSKGC
jgi:hypothetical protein